MRKVLLTLGAVVAAFFVLVPVANAGKVPSRVEIDDHWFDKKDGAWYFTGTVSSRKSKCEVDRKVTVFVREFDSHQLAERLGSARTFRDGGRGRFVIEDPNNGQLAKYVAKVKRVRKGNTVCKADRSPVYFKP